MAIDSGSLSALPYFKGLKLTELDSIKPSFFEKVVQRGEIIFFEGEPADSLFFLVSGIVKLFKTSAQGKEQIISLARPQEVLNDIPVFDNGLNPMSAQAMNTVVLYGITREKLGDLLRQHPAISSRIIEVLAARTRQLISLVEDLSFKHVIGRVAKILLENTGDGAGHQRLTQQEMAAIAGTAREVVARSLKTLEERGLIRMERQKIVITNKNALQEMINQEV
jgi:CRP-like cAMP-binding protein